MRRLERMSAAPAGGESQAKRIRAGHSREGPAEPFRSAGNQGEAKRTAQNPHRGHGGNGKTANRVTGQLEDRRAVCLPMDDHRIKNRHCMEDTYPHEGRGYRSHGGGRTVHTRWMRQ